MSKENKVIEKINADGFLQLNAIGITSKL